MPDIDAPGEDVLEQRQAPEDPTAALGEVPGGLDLEAPEADAAEQRTEVRPGQGAVDRELPLDADEADAAEQAIEVGGDEDDYR